MEKSGFLESKAFADWGELKDNLVNAYQLEDLSIQLRPEYINSEKIECMNRIDVREVSGNEVLLSLMVGMRLSLDVHFFKKFDRGGLAKSWLPQSDHRAILMSAKGVYCRGVRDRVVELMSARGRMGVVSVFLDCEGRVESASGLAREFCETYLPAPNRIDDYFPEDFWDYLQGAIRLRDSESPAGYGSESLVFGVQQDGRILDCLLQKMGGSGYLLSMALDR